jgi:hypothetical protein
MGYVVERRRSGIDLFLGWTMLFSGLLARPAPATVG